MKLCSHSTGAAHARTFRLRSPPQTGCAVCAAAARRGRGCGCDDAPVTCSSGQQKCAEDPLPAAAPEAAGATAAACRCRACKVSSLHTHTQCSYYIKSPGSRHARNHNVASTLHSMRQQQCLRSNFPARTCYDLARVRAHLHPHHCSWAHPEQAPLRAPVPVQRGRPQVPLPRALAFHLRRKICTSHKDQASRYSRRMREVGDETNSACPSPTSGYCCCCCDTSLQTAARRAAPAVSGGAVIVSSVMLTGMGCVGAEG